ncbi:hypothetical protein NEMBOFW57_009480 [Staphylotrichum longicolle]|uniref:SHSP domain-containing protein n=1 Tax=Staphylotrichum longicolle TaxID=669026 RepID=A0AAD4HW01_9PEZI|nr:hypothetical protein NEMBOFW57_009480 [Staphylotrichum longicolle]
MSSLRHPRFSHTGAAAPGFSSLFRMLDDFDRYASQQLGSTQGSTSVTAFSPKFDVTEQENGYVLQSELPGVAPENTLVVRGHSERKHTEGDPALLEAPTEQKKIEGGEGGWKKDTGVAKGKENGEGQVAKSKPRYWLSERSYGEFSRVFTFPATVDQDNVQAKFKDGILDITVPKAEKRGGKKITIH